MLAGTGSQERRNDNRYIPGGVLGRHKGGIIMGMVKGAVKGVAVAGVVGLGTVAALGALEKSDAESIRSMGDKIGGFVSGIGEKLENSETAKDLADKINSTKYGPQAMSFVSSARDAVSSGFGKFVDALADSRQAAEDNGTSLTGELASRLTGLIADGAEFAAEKLDSVKNFGQGFGTQAVSYEAEADVSDVQAEEPDIDV